MCWRPPPGRWNSRAMPRGAGAASGTLGSPPPSEKRATTGMGLPENRAERLRTAASLVPVNSPTAHVPLMWFRRWPGCTPNVPSKASIICDGVTSVPEAGGPAARAGHARRHAARGIRAKRTLAWGRVDFTSVHLWQSRAAILNVRRGARHDGASNPCCTATTWLCPGSLKRFDARYGLRFAPPGGLIHVRRAGH